MSKTSQNQYKVQTGVTGNSVRYYLVSGITMNGKRIRFRFLREEKALSAIDALLRSESFLQQGTPRSFPTLRAS